jgi:hypothetical protein
MNLAPDEAGLSEHRVKLVSHNLEKSIPPESPLLEIAYERG